MDVKNSVQYVEENKCYLFYCPHCELPIQVEKNQVNCSIFRHAIMKEGGTQVNPHAPKNICDKLFEEKKVYGCCKPFRLLKNEKGEVNKVEICDYI